MALTTIPLVAVGLAAATGLLRRAPTPIGEAVAVATLPLLVLFGIGLAAQQLPRPTPPAPVPLRPPVHGRWRAMNSPATKVPSHGTHAYGQTYAIDLVEEPADGSRPRFGGRTAMRDPREYPAFGAVVTSPVDGVVVAARDGRRDHRCRSNLLGCVYMLGEGLVLSLRGAGGVMGNHLIVAIDGEGPYVAIAHLQRGSVAVAVGDRVRAGEEVARVGNSGNSSEPHIHLHVMDRARPGSALGQPFVFLDVQPDVAATGGATPGGAATGQATSRGLVPANDEVFHALAP